MDAVWNASYNLSNSRGLPGYNKNFTQSISSKKVIIEMTVHCIIFGLGTVGNILVVLVILCNKSMRCTTNWLVLNLAASDLGITLFNIPLTNMYHFTGWPFGKTLCKYFLGAFGECIVGVSVFTHTSLALIRYHVVLNPMRCTIRLKHVQFCIATTWLLAYATLSAPLTGQFKLVYSPVINGYVCKPAWPSFEYKIVYRSCVFIVTYVIPIVIATVCYVNIYNALRNSMNFFRKGSAVNASQMLRREYRSKRLTKALFILYTLFTITTLPLEIFYVLIDARVLPISVYLAHVWSLLVALFYGLSVVNPIMLFYISEEYRNQLINMFRICRLSKKEETNTPNSANKTSAKRSTLISQNGTQTIQSRKDSKKPCEGEGKKSSKNEVELQLLKQIPSAKEI